VVLFHCSTPMRREGTEVNAPASNPQEAAKKGLEIYETKYQKDFEKKFPGKYVAIDISTGEAYVADSPEEALGIAQGKNSKGFFHLIRIGSPGVFRISYAQNSAREWFA